MRALFVSNLYPPHHEGGYELRCAQVARALGARGCEVRVLTSDVRIGDGDGREGGAGDDEAVERRLTHYRRTAPGGPAYTWALGRSQIEDVRIFAEVMESFRPDIVAWWNMEGLSKALLSVPASFGIPDVAFIEDSWMINEYGDNGENDPFRWFDFLEGAWGPRFLRPVARLSSSVTSRTLARGRKLGERTRLAPCHVCFVSEFLRFEHSRRGLELPSTSVLYGGVDVDRFRAERRPEEFRARPLKLLFVGYLSPDRGLRSLIEAFGLLDQLDRRTVTLTIAYGGPLNETSYTGELKRRIHQLGLGERIRFMKRVPHEQMPALYRAHQLLVVPTSRAEGLPLTIMEAMAAGTPVITTGSGGAIELADRVPVPLFPAEHPIALSRLLSGLVNAPEELADLGARGQRLVCREFTFDRMIREIRSTFERFALPPGGPDATPGARPGAVPSPEVSR